MLWICCMYLLRLIDVLIVQVCGMSWCTAACLELCCSSSDGAAVPLETEGK